SDVRTAAVAVGALPQIHEHAATGLRDYANQVDEIERRLHARYQRGAGLLQNYATAIAKRQSEQINRLTLVSIIFLPITFLTGFFGMNFGWMVKTIGSPSAFLLLGLMLPAASIVLTLVQAAVTPVRLGSARRSPRLSSTGLDALDQIIPLKFLPIQ